MNKKGQFNMKFEGIIALIFLFLVFVFFAPFFFQLVSGNINSALNALAEIFVPLIILGIIITIIRRFF